MNEENDPYLMKSAITAHKFLLDSMEMMQQERHEANKATLLELENPSSNSQLLTFKNEHFLSHVPLGKIDELFNGLKGVYIPEDIKMKENLRKVFSLEPLKIDEKILWVDRSRTGPHNLSLIILVSELIEEQQQSKLKIYDFIRMSFECSGIGGKEAVKPININSLRSSYSRYNKNKGQMQDDDRIIYIRNLCDQILG